MKKRKAKAKPDKFELWLESWKNRLDDEMAAFTESTNPTYAKLYMVEYRSALFALDEYRKFKRRKK